MSVAERFERGHLRVSGQAEIYYELSGNPSGKPALFLHGGPGRAPVSGGYRRYFDPEKHLIVGIVQRGCGRSRPLDIDALDRLHENMTQALIEDIEVLREHLGIRLWLVAGVSWGSTLALAYAQAHPGRVSAMVLAAVTSTSREEIDWITEGIGRVFPEAWQRFADASGRRSGERIAEAMHRIDRVPAMLIHGRRDISGPVITARRLHRRWPSSRLAVVEEEGHGGPEMMRRMRLACDAFA